MNPRSMLACVAAVSGLVSAWAQTPAAPAATDAPAAPAAKAKAPAAAPAKAPAAKTDPKKAGEKSAAKPAPKKEEAKPAEETGKIEGMEIARGGGFLGLQIVNGTFKLSFYDAKKKPAKPDVVRAALRWNVPYQKAPERAVLSVNDTALVSDKIVRPPYTFKLFITLFKTAGDGGEGSDAGAETLTIDFSQS